MCDFLNTRGHDEINNKRKNLMVSQVKVCVFVFAVAVFVASVLTVLSKIA